MTSSARILPFLLLLAAHSGAAAAGEVQVQVQRLGDRALMLSVPGTDGAENVGAFASERGLVVVDATLGPRKAAAVRSAIAEAFGRGDFRYLINTHDHEDHTGGNQIFSDALIVGHERLAAEMRRIEIGFEDYIATRQGWVKSLKARLSALDPQSDQAAQDGKDLSSLEDLLAERGPGFRVTPPEVTFNDRLTIHLGDLTVHLIYYGASHTDGDTLVHIPEAGVLMTGDLFAADRLPRIDARRSDAEPWLAALDRVLDGGGAVEHVVPGHGRILSAAELRAQRDYIRELWDGVAAAYREGLSLAETKERFPFRAGFQGLAHLDPVHQGTDLHAQNLESFWSRHVESAASKLGELIEEKGLEAAVAEYRATVMGSDRYRTDEAEFIRLGYRLLYGARIAGAVEVLKLGAEIFPDAWNMHDSLGEAWLYAGNKEQAASSYRRSLELNPGNENGRMKLENVDLEIVEFRLETRVRARYRPGEPTGLRGPYLGQEPPGLEPRVFAPGIVSTMGGHEFSIGFSPDGRELYFNRGPNIWVSRLGEEGWTAPAPAPFNTRFLDHEAHVTADGRKLFFGSGRPRPGVTEASYGIWVMERTAGGWGEPRYHGPGMYVTTAANGNLYVTDISGQPDSGVLVRSRLIDGRYGDLEPLGGPLNSPYNEWHPCVAPDESFLVFDSDRPGGPGGNGDLYVSFQRDDGSWGDPVLIKEISSPGTEMTASLSPDGRYLFFYAHHDIHWVSTGILERYKAKEPS